MTETEKDLLSQLIDTHKNSVHQLNREVWNAAELGFKEIKSVQAFKSRLVEAGFSWSDGVAGIPTAFCASYGTEGPVIGILAEYDALPQLGQESGVPQHCPKGENGHGCGHNMLGAAAFGAALAVRSYLNATRKPGQIRLYGCPAEENGCGKTFMAREGVFNDLDAALCWHPHEFSGVWTESTLANIHIKFSFQGKTAHAAAAPELGRSALDAAELMNIGVQFLREHIDSQARIHYAFLDVGGPAPNVVQDSSSLLYHIRAPKAAQSREIAERVERIAKGAALMTDTQVQWRVVSGLSDYVPNRILSTLMDECFQEVGAPTFDAQDFKTAKEFFDHAYPQDIVLQNKAHLKAMFGAELGSALADAPLCTMIRPLRFENGLMSGSTDVGDVSYVVPTAQLACACYALGTVAHTWQLTAQGTLPAAEKAVDTVSHVLAMTAIRAMEEPELLASAKDELLQTTNGQYICPIPSEVTPAL